MLSTLMGRMMLMGLFLRKLGHRDGAQCQLQKCVLGEAGNQIPGLAPGFARGWMPLASPFCWRNSDMT